MTMRPFILTIDGPAGAGKSSVSKVLARRLGFSLVDTGAIYRCVALAALREGIALDDDGRLGALLDRLSIGFEIRGDENRVTLDGADVTSDIRAPEVSMAASSVSARPVVRAGLLGLQRRLALEASRGAILEGRDTGTVVFPDADAKFYLEADEGVRARRRFEELFQKGVERTLDEVLSEQSKRDRDDSSRELAPLRPADDAVRVDSSAMPLSEVVRFIERVARDRIRARGGES